MVTLEVLLRPVRGQVDDLLAEIKKRSPGARGSLQQPLQKRMAEDLTDYYSKMGIKVRYLPTQEIDTLERVEIIDDLREGVNSTAWWV